MKKRIFPTLLLLLILLLVTACVFPPIFGDSSIEFNFLENDSLARFNPTTQDIDSLVLQEEPWLTQDDIVFYDWSAHLMFLNKNRSEILSDYYPDSSLQWSMIEQPFAVSVNNSPVYLGFFKNFFTMTEYYSNPTITDFEFLFYAEDVLTFTTDPSFNNDLLQNNTLKKALKGK
jgi:hypothetical protein